MNRKQFETLRSIFKDSILSNLSWTDVESLFIALGADLTEGSGSRVRVYFRGVRAVFHRPHPEKEIDKGALRSV